jgi:hypothetical protein
VDRVQSSRFRRLLPREHGAWAFLFLPLAAGWVVAPSRAGLLFTVAALAGFLMKEPWQRLGWEPRSPGLRAWLAGLGGVGALAAVGGALLSGPAPLVPLGLGAAAAAAVLLRRAPTFRGLGAEMAGILSLSSLLPALLLAGGWGPGAVLPAWGILVLLSLPPLLYVRRCLALARAQAPPDGPWAWLLPLAALGAALALWGGGRVPALLPAWASLLALRALAPPRRAPARRVGWTESLVGLGHLGVLVACFRGG